MTDHYLFQQLTDYRLLTLFFTACGCGTPDVFCHFNHAKYNTVFLV